MLPRALALMLLMTSLASAAGPHDAKAPRYGEHLIASDWQGFQLSVSRLRRENFNAHGFDVWVLHARNLAEPGNPPALVSVFDGADEKLVLATQEGADCQLRDYRIRLNAQGEVLLLRAQREMGDSYASEAPVEFTEFALIRNAEGVPGSPALHFETRRKWRSSKTWCDVGAALENEPWIDP
jgi:hypothetical protein